ncbi:hypothetical protein ACFQL7_27555 [Halocatena marina]|uniref:Uncharacterized protein n=1 Tax=Halocatena marina TaxID=2934937 RepID=A0ABD5YVQ7_9EURY
MASREHALPVRECRLKRAVRKRIHQRLEVFTRESRSERRELTLNDRICAFYQWGRERIIGRTRHHNRYLGSRGEVSNE